MKPQKLFKKAVLLALVLAVLGGVLVTSATAAETATSAIPSTPASVYNMLNGKIGEWCPATSLRNHDNAKMFLDKDSASKVL